MVAEDHVQSSEVRDDGATTLKRQKTRRPKQTTTRSRSAVDTYRKGGRGALDIAGIVDENELRQRIDAFWSPPELELLAKKSAAFQSTPVAETLESSADDSSGHGFLYRRYSDPSESPRATISSESSPGNVASLYVSTFRNSSLRVPRTPDSLPRGKSRSLEAESKLSIEQCMDRLLLEVEDEMPLSERGKTIRDRIAEDNRQKARKAALLAAKELRLRRRSPLKPLVQALNTKWDRMVYNAESTNNQHQVITTSMEGTELRLKDFRTLLGRHAWLNDEIINSYIEWIVLAANSYAVTVDQALGEPTSTVPKFIAHNSFFYENLRKKGPQSTERLMKRKKAPGEKLLDVDTVFVPICQGSHWTIGVVRPVAKTIEYFDSMGGRPQIFISQMRAWLQFQLGKLYHAEEWTEPRTACARQTNGYDCGVFVCTNAFCVAMGLDTSCYEERDMALQRRNIAAVLLNRGFGGDFAWNQGGLLP